MPQTINEFLGLPGPQHDLPPVLRDLVSVAGLRADHIPARGQQLCVRLCQADNVRTVSVDSFADFRGAVVIWG